MRHRKSGRKLNRTNSHRKAMFRNMARALLTYERIRTTEAKAKELRKVVESLITLAIRDDLHSRRLAYKALNNHQMVQRLFDEIGPRFKEGGGGYTRILKLSKPRKGDCAPMVIIELTKKADDLEGAEEIKAEAPAKEAKKAAPKKSEKKAAPKKEKAPKAEAEEPKVEEPKAEEADAPVEEASDDASEDKKDEDA